MLTAIQKEIEAKLDRELEKPKKTKKKLFTLKKKRRKNGHK